MNRVVGIGALVHALVVTALWVGPLFFEARVVTAPVWLMLAWTWIAWPVLLISTRARFSRPAVIAVIVGGLIVLAGTPPIFAFTAWSLSAHP